VDVLDGALKRVLLVDRGALARRAMWVWRGLGIETVVAFGVADAEVGWVDEADYAVFHGGGVGELAAPDRVVSAAMDAGCDAIDPGPLADDPTLLDLALRSNLAIVGCDPMRAPHYRDPDWVIARAADVGVPAAPIGPWPESASLRRLVDVLILVDRQTGSTVLGALECSVGTGPETPWLMELGEIPGQAGREAMVEASIALVEQVGGPGLIRVRWGRLDETSWALRGVSTWPGPGWPLVTAAHGLDLSWARVAAWRGGSGVEKRLVAKRHAVMARVVAVGTGVLGHLVLPPSGLEEVEVGVTVQSGEAVASIVSSAPSRQAALVRLGRDLDQVQVDGVPTGLDALVRLAGNRDLWDGRMDLQAIAALLGN